jgi:DNA polymerase
MMKVEEAIQRNFPGVLEEYKQFALQKDKCRRCPIYGHYKQVIQSEGCTQRPAFMFIGEGPGKDEVEQNRPFIGLAGQRLRKELRKYSDTFRRDNTLISNVLACRPLNNKFPDEYHVVSVCVNTWVKKEIQLVRPKIIITLGNPALRYIRGDSGITLNRGKWKFLPQYKVWSLATFHPSYVIRSERSSKQFVVDQFERDIKTISDTWATIITSDYRVAMSDEEWAQEWAEQKAIDLGLIK